jgi:hypothetical protein
MVGERNVPLKVSNFVPRPGYQGPEPKPGFRLRCERCQGPVFLENTTIVTPATPVRLRPRSTAAITREKVEAA